MNSYFFIFFSIIALVASGECLSSIDSSLKDDDIYVEMKSKNVAGEVVYYWDLNNVVGKDVVSGFVQLRFNSITERYAGENDSQEYSEFTKYFTSVTQPSWDVFNLSKNILYVDDFYFSFLNDSQSEHKSKTSKNNFAYFLGINIPPYSVIDFHPVLYAKLHSLEDLIMVEGVKYNLFLTPVPSDLSESNLNDINNENLLVNSLNGPGLISKMTKNKFIELLTDDYVFLLGTDIYQTEVLREYLWELRLIAQKNKLAMKDVDYIELKVKIILLVMYFFIFLVVLLISKLVFFKIFRIYFSERRGKILH